MLEFLCNKAAGRSGTLLLKYSCFPVKFAKFFRRPILENICKWQLQAKLCYVLPIKKVKYYANDVTIIKSNNI